MLPDERAWDDERRDLLLTVTRVAAVNARRVAEAREDHQRADAHHRDAEDLHRGDALAEADGPDRVSSTTIATL